jgi:ABC-type glycerol-3-phosphate transport system substrate-binding protein
LQGFGAELVDADGRIKVRSDNVRNAIDYARRLMRFLPADVYSWDDASNNRALISGKSALIINPPSAWAGAMKDNPSVGEQIWHHPMPAGECGRFLPIIVGFWGVWRHSKNKAAAKELILWLSQREQVERICDASRGMELPAFSSMTDFPIWDEIGPPKGTLFNYPLKPHHHAEPTVVGWPAPPAIATQIAAASTAPKMIARVTQSGLSIEESIALAEQELEAFMR